MFYFRWSCPVKVLVFLMNSTRISFCNYRRFSPSASTLPSSLPWISPVQYLKPACPLPDPPPETTITLIEPPRKPSFLSHELAINLIKHETDPQRALDIFNSASEQKGFNHNNATYATILYTLAKSKKFKAVDAIIRQMAYETCRFHENIFLSLMKHFSKSSLHEKVLDMFYAIQPIVRVKPSPKAISTCLNLLVESKRDDLAQKVLLHSKNRLNLEPNTCIFNILIKHHSNNGNFESAFEVLKEMRKSKISYPNVITYSILMDGLCKNGRLTEAMELFEQMVSEDQILPDALVYNVLIKGFCHGGKVDRAKKIIEFMKNHGCNPNVFNYSALMNGYAKEGRVAETKEVFNDLKSAGLKPDTIVYTTLISCLCRAGGINEAIELLGEMKENGCQADTITFNTILGGLCREGRFQDALLMLERLPYDLNKKSYRIVLNSLCKEGELKRAFELLCLMLDRGFVPHYATSNDFLIRVCKAGMVEEAVSALCGLVEMGFKPESDCWTGILELIFSETNMVLSFEVFDELVKKELGNIL